MPVFLQSSQHEGSTGERLAVLVTEDLLNFLQPNISKFVSTWLAGEDIAAGDTMWGSVGGPPS